MTATEELRAMLDERGVEWMPIAWNPKRETFYHTSNGVGFCADEYADGVKIYTDATITPEQAIAATLGAGECTLESTHAYCDPYVRTAYQIELSCHTLDAWDDPVPPSYCPYCGKRVVKEDA